MPPARSVRVYAPQFPFPVTEGAFQVIYDQLRSLLALGLEVELVVWKDSAAEVMRRRTGEFPAAIRVVTLPGERPRIGGESQAGRALRVAGSLASDVASPEALYYPRAIAPCGQPDVRKALERPVDLAIYHSSFSHSWLEQKLPSENRRAVFFHNLESDLFAERARAARPPGAWIHELNARKLLRHEAELSTRVEELWFISPRDQTDYRGRVPEARALLRFVPPTYAPELRSLRESTPRRRPEALVIGLLGGFHFHPNLESAEWVVRELAPRLESRGFSGELQIVGRGAPAALIERARRFSFIRFTGFQPDLEEFWSSLSYSLVPHFSGSGVRTKLLEALASGVPTLATEAAVERISPSLRSHPLLLPSDSADAWAERIASAKPFAERDSSRGTPLPPELDGRRVYDFLKLSP